MICRKGLLMVLVAALVVSISLPTRLFAAGPDKVKVAYVAIMNFAPLYVAIGRDFMKEQNIEVDMQKVASGTEAMAFLAQGSLDAGGVGITAATFNAFNKGFDMRIVALCRLATPEERAHDHPRPERPERLRVRSTPSPISRE